MMPEIMEFLTRSAGMPYKNMLFALLFAVLLGVYIFFVYRIISKDSFYSKSFNITLPVITVLTAAIVVAMQANLVVSLGMVGALSIVRYRTALKDPMDLAFIFWAITTGIISGTEIYGLALIVAVIVTIALFVLDQIKLKQAPRLLVVNGKNADYESELNDILEQYRVNYAVKSRNINKGHLDMIYEIETDDGELLVREIGSLDSIFTVSILDHDGSLRY